MYEPLNNACPRCHARRLCAWRELDEEQRELVRRLPASADYTLSERQTKHLWCANCWYETTGSGTCEV